MRPPKAPDARVRMSDSTAPFKDAEIKGMLLNPSYVFGGIIDEETFIAAAARLISENGIEDYLSNMLFAMMRLLTPHHDPHDAIPSEAAWLDWAKATMDDHAVDAGIKIVLADLREKYGRYFAS